MYNENNTLLPRHPVPGLAALLLEQSGAVDHHAAIDGLAHVVDPPGNSVNTRA
jgi:uncharacterized protein YcbX